MNTRILLKNGFVAAFFCVVLLPATAQDTRNDRNQKAVRVLTREVALRVFAEFAKEKDPQTKKPNALAGTIADSLTKSPAEADAIAIITTIDRKPSFGGAKEKLAELARFTPAINISDKILLDVLESNFVVWRKKYKDENNAYLPRTIPAEAMMAAVAAYLKKTQQPTNIDELSNTNSSTISGVLSETIVINSPTKTNFFWMGLLLFSLGAVVATSAAFWFWYRPKRKLIRQWQTIGGTIKTLNIPDVSFKKSIPNETEITSLIETLHDRAKGNFTEAQGQTPSHRAELLARIKKELGDGDEVTVIRGLKAEIMRLEKEIQRLLNASESKTPTQQPSPNTGQPSHSKTAITGNGNKTQQPQPVIVFFAQPSPGGIFDNDQRSDQPTPDSFYKFSMRTETDNTATFRLAGNADDMPRLLNFRHVFIDPACESQNNYQPSHNRVDTLSDGKAERINGQWQVSTKAKIRFE